MIAVLSYKVVGRHIRDARERLALTQQEVADMVKISIGYYGKIERGDIRPNLDRLAQICEALSMPICDLFKGASLGSVDMTNIDPTEDDFLEFCKGIAASSDLGRRKLIMAICREITNYNIF